MLKNTATFKHLFFRNIDDSDSSISQQIKYYEKIAAIQREIKGIYGEEQARNFDYEIKRNTKSNIVWAKFFERSKYGERIARVGQDDD